MLPVKVFDRSSQLDSLRGIAVSLVVLHHWTNWAPDWGLGNVGVQLFFVLSGFLITRILFGFKDRHAAGIQAFHEALLSSHTSRIARIWPVFFLTLALVFAAGDRFEHRKDMAWHVLLASNLLFFERGEFGSSLSHFWSLAVEQQFYLFWPLLVLLVPHRRLKLIIIALVALAPVTRLMFYTLGFTHFAEYNVLPPANLDSLGLGALAAVWSQPQEIDERRKRAFAVLAIGCVVLLCVLGLAKPLPANLEQSLCAVVFAWLVIRAKDGFRGPLGRILEVAAPSLAWRHQLRCLRISYVRAAYRNGSDESGSSADGSAIWSASVRTGSFPDIGCGQPILGSDGTADTGVAAKLAGKPSHGPIRHIDQSRDAG